VTVGFSQDDKSRLTELLSRELEIFKQVLDNTVKQTELLAEDDAYAFNISLDLRQELIEKINGLHQESDILMQSYISYCESGGGERIAEIDAITDRLRNIISECAGINERNEAAAKEMAEGYIKRIDKLNVTRKSLRKYIHDLPNNPELFDRIT